MANPNSKLRDKLWHEDPHCMYCGTLTILPKPGQVELEDNTATLDHMFGRGHPYREMEGTKVLACNRCNNAKGQLEISKSTSSEAFLQTERDKILKDVELLFLKLQLIETMRLWNVEWEKRIALQVSKRKNELLCLLNETNQGTEPLKEEMALVTLSSQIISLERA